MAKRKLVLPGQIVATKKQESYGVEQVVHVEVSADRDMPAAVSLDGLDDDLLELEWADGVVEVVRIDEYAARGGARGPDDEVVVRSSRAELPASAPRHRATIEQPVESSRSLVRLANVALTRVPDALVAELEAKASSSILASKGPALVEQVERWTTFRGREEGLFQVGPNAELTPVGGPVSTTDGKPALLLLHGTFSHVGAFDDLFHSGDSWKAIRERYGVVLAYQHFTLSKSPAENAFLAAEALAKALVPGTVIDLVSHSRGGLVGECLLSTVGPTSWNSLLGSRTFKKVDPNISAILQDAAKLPIRADFGRFVRVACPMRGTTLLSTRIDRLATAVFTAASLAGAGANPYFQAAKFLVRFLLKTRRDPATVPGLAAMDPENGLLGLLNDPIRTTRAEVGELRGSTQARGLLGSLKVGAARILFGRDNDLVVDTDAMIGGAATDHRARFTLRSDAIDHFKYFSDRETREALVTFLKVGADAPGWSRQRDGMRSDRGERGAAVRMAKAVPEPNRVGGRPRLILVPGIMGSRLSVTHEGQVEDVWFEYGPLTRGKFGLLAAVAAGDGVRVNGVMADGYDEFVAYFSQRYDVHLFPYDWRRSVIDSGALLAEIVRDLLADPAGLPVHIVAHSMGGLVVRGMLAAASELDEHIRKRGGRIIMAGTPNKGSYEMLHLVAEEEDSVLGALSLVDLEHKKTELAEMVRGFLGVLEMMPWAGSGDWDTPLSRAWTANRAPERRLLDEARKTQHLLSDRMPKSLIYVAGTARNTIDHIEADHSYATTDAGDGRVTYETGIPPGAKTYYLNAVHGSLLAVPSSYEAFHELLTFGETSGLSTTPITPSFSATVRRWFGSSREAAYRPTEAELLELLLCANAETSTAPAETRVRCSVVGDGVHEARFPVLVGHFSFDAITGPESILDTQLKGALRRRHSLGRYVSAAGTAFVHLDAGSRPEGAIVVGLGDLRDVSERTLRAAIRAGVLELLLLEPHRTGVSSLLIGRNTSLSTEQAVRAIAAGVVDANLDLARRGIASQIRELEFIEVMSLYAGAAYRELERVAEAKTLPLDVVPGVHVGDAHRDLLGARPQDRSWIPPVIIEVKQDTLEFHMLTDRARTDHTVTHVQLDIVGRAAASIATSTASEGRNPNRAPLGYVLYRLLVPEVLRSAMRDGTGLLLVVTPEAAALPWEMLEDSPQRERKPPAIEMPIIRQLRTKESRSVPAAMTRRAVVLGNLETKTAPLPRAADEARRVANDLETAQFDVQSVIAPEGGASLLDILQTVLAQPIDVLHIATHGSVITVAGDKRARIHLGNDQYLDARTIRQLSDAALPAPRLVFLNCCHLGVNQDPAAFAGNIAAAFIELGTSVVVAAGWAVDDAAASTFARSFYADLLKGKALSIATLNARAETFRLHEDVNTWGAYQVYGKPDFQLTNSGAVSGRETEPLIVEAQLWIELEKLRSRLHFTTQAHEYGAKDLEELERRWVELHQRGGEKGEPTDGALWEAFGDIWRLLVRPEPAIAAYGKAKRDPRRRASARLLENELDAHTRLLRSLRDRFGTTLDITHPGPWTDAINHRKRVEALTSVEGEGTAARFAAVAAAYKETSRTSPDPRSDLYQAFEHYRSSFLAADNDEARVYPVAALHWMELAALAQGRQVPSVEHLHRELAWIRAMDLRPNGPDATLATADTYLQAHLDFLLRPGQYQNFKGPHPTRMCVIEWLQYGFATVVTPWRKNSFQQVLRWFADQAASGSAVESARSIDDALDNISSLPHARPSRPERRTDWISERFDALESIPRWAFRAAEVEPLEATEESIKARPNPFKVSAAPPNTDDAPQ